MYCSYSKYSATLDDMENAGPKLDSFVDKTILFNTWDDEAEDVLFTPLTNKTSSPSQTNSGGGKARSRWAFANMDEDPADSSPILDPTPLPSLNLPQPNNYLHSLYEWKWDTQHVLTPGLDDSPKKYSAPIGPPPGFQTGV